jgi:hypothetical protein
MTPYKTKNKLHLNRRPNESAGGETFNRIADPSRKFDDGFCVVSRLAASGKQNPTPIARRSREIRQDLRPVIVHTRVSILRFAHDPVPGHRPSRSASISTGPLTWFMIDQAGSLTPARRLA